MLPVCGVWILSSQNNAIRTLIAVPQGDGSSCLPTPHLSQLGLNTSRGEASDLLRNFNTYPHSVARLIQRENNNCVFLRSGELEVFASLMIFQFTKDQ